MEQNADALGALALTDAVLERLKEESAEGCLLCILGAFAEEDWD